MRFAYPYLLLTLLLVPLLVWLKHFMLRKQSMQFSSSSILNDLPKNWRVRLQPILPVLYVLGLVCLVVALARPQRGLQESRVRTEAVDIILLIERQRESLRRQIIMANRSEDFSAQITILQSIPGIAEIWSCIIVAEVGPFDRFPNADALEFWAGLTADLKESAGRTQSGKITKAGSATLRWALCKAGVTLCKSDARQEAIRQRLISKAGNAKANVAMGRRLLRTIYAMFRDWSFYQAGQRTNHLAAANKARAKKRKTKKEAA